MNDIETAHLDAERLLILTATYGDGDAPASARRFLDRVGGLERRIPVAVLGFGDRTFPNFCGYAHKVAAALDAKGWPRLLSPKRIDRRSAQEFAQWGHDLGAALGCDLALEHVSERPKTTAFELVERETYGVAVGAPVAILRFARADARRRTPAAFRGRRPRRHPRAGRDLPRFYSLASSHARRRARNLRPAASRRPLLDLPAWSAAGDRIEAFIRENPTFRPAKDASPLILIGSN